MSISPANSFFVGPDFLPQHRLASILLVALLCSCAALDHEEPSHQSLAAEVRAEMARCVDAQKASDQRFALQEKRLSAQAEQLSEITATLTALEAGQQQTPERAMPITPACAPVASAPGKMMVGRLESVWLEDFQLSLPARVDTGAETASLDARNIELFERDGDAWVRFEIVHPQSGEAISLERELVRK
ncbi:MAG: RimK/LysX family protein, partial [Halieaceae bacterium]